MLRTVLEVIRCKTATDDDAEERKKKEAGRIGEDEKGGGGGVVVVIGPVDASNNNSHETTTIVGADRDSDSPKKSFTMKQKVALMMLALAEFMSFCSMSILAPFYTKENSDKGLSDTTAGFVFSFYALVVFLSSPVFGKILPKFGARCLFVSGLLFSGIFNIIFGVLQYVQNGVAFSVLSFVLRGAEALGASAYSTAGYVLVINIFPQNAGAVRGILETFVGLGLSAGPALGGFLYAEDWRFRSTVLRAGHSNRLGHAVKHLAVAGQQEIEFRHEARLVQEPDADTVRHRHLLHHHGRLAHVELLGPDRRAAFAKIQSERRQRRSRLPAPIGDVRYF